ncbi:hypothetical protein ScPMuIL_005905 [Solemya velum]
MDDKEVSTPGMEGDLSPQPSRAMQILEKFHLVDKGAVPFNWRIINLCFLNLFGSAMCLSFLFPFLPEMVLSFGYSEEDKGYYAGLIASSLFAGRMVGSYFWGWLADRKGRRTIIIVTVFGNAVFSLAFGFSQSFAMAVVFRVLAGAVNAYGVEGGMNRQKTICRFCTRSRITPIRPLLCLSSPSPGGAGIIIGPTLGGFLASPAKRYSHVFSEEGVFGQFPYLLPSLIVAILCSIAVVLDIFFLPETRTTSVLSEEIIGDVDDEGADTITGLDRHSMIKSLERLHPKVALSVEDLHIESEAPYFFAQLDIQRRADADDYHSSEHSIHHHRDHDKTFPKPVSAVIGEDKALTLSDSCLTGLVERKRVKSEGDQQSTLSPPLNRYQKHAYSTDEEEAEERMLQQSGSPEDKKKKDSSFWFTKKLRNTVLVELLSQSGVRKSVFLYTLFSFASIGYDEVFTVWCSTRTGLDGLGFSPDEIGAILGLTAIPLLLIQFFIFPVMVRKFQIKWTFIISIGIQMVIVSCTATLHLLVDSPKWLWAGLLLMCIPRQLASSSCFTATSLFINNSVRPEQVGAVNGIGMTLTAVARTLAPTIGGSIFAWTVGYAAEKIGPPFDVDVVSQTSTRKASQFDNIDSLEAIIVAFQKEDKHGKLISPPLAITDKPLFTPSSCGDLV